MSQEGGVSEKSLKRSSRNMWTLPKRNKKNFPYISRFPGQLAKLYFKNWKKYNAYLLYIYFLHLYTQSFGKRDNIHDQIRFLQSQNRLFLVADTALLRIEMLVYFLKIRTYKFYIFRPSISLRFSWAGSFRRRIGRSKQKCASINRWVVLEKFKYYSFLIGKCLLLLIMFSIIGSLSQTLLFRAVTFIGFVARILSTAGVKR